MSFPALREYMAQARRYHTAYSKVGSVPPWPAYERLTRERWTILSQMTQEQRDVAIAEEREAQQPALMATKEFLDEAIAARKGGQRTWNAFMQRAQARSDQASSEAKRVAKAAGK